MLRGHRRRYGSRKVTARRCLSRFELSARTIRVSSRGRTAVPGPTRSCQLSRRGSPRVLVVGALALSKYVVDHIGSVNRLTAAAVHDGLLSWDGAWYSDIASKGYSALPREALRFFPGLPVMARTLGLVGIGDRPALVILSNASAFAAGVLLYRLVRWETGDRSLAVRSVWLFMLAPPAFVFVMGYTDASAVALAIATFSLLRRKQWWGAALCGLVLGVFRPTGLLIAVPALIEGVRGISHVPWRERCARSAAIVAAPVGAFAYLAWVRSQFGSLFLPFSEQTHAHLRGHLTDPASSFVHGVRSALDGHLGSALHLPWFVLIVVLTVVVCRRWPLAYSAFTVAVVVSATTSNNLDSMERYALFAFPLVVAAAQLIRSRDVERIVFVAAVWCDGRLRLPGVPGIDRPVARRRGSSRARSQERPC